MASTAENIANLQTRRDAIYAELAAMTSTSVGGKPNYSIDGQSVDHVTYRKSLYEELGSINDILASIGGPIEEVTYGY
jgi:hypothetical protein